MKTAALLAILLLGGTASANSMEDALCPATAIPVQRMEASEKLCRSFARALVQLPAATAKEASALLAPENLALMTSMLVAWMGTQGIPIVGQAVDAALLSLGVVMLAVQSAELAQALWQYANKARSARSHEELDDAGAHLARAIAIGGINIVALILTRRAARGIPSGPPGPSPRLATAQGPQARVALKAEPPSVATMMSSNPRPPRTFAGHTLKRVNLEAFARWVRQAPRRPAQNSPEAYRYQQKHAGPEEILLEGGGEKIWADGLRMDTARIVEVKFIAAPEKSPFIENSQCNARVRAVIQEEVTGEFRRYAAIIADTSTPAVGLQVILNDARAVPFFERLLRTLGIPGEVLIQP
ncbi:restriction endonuclease fold toxin-2 domain-containing protein [Hyalangium gracile]|uniref:restriction endonuclease fold toxin-2 domain-containing protein n=1 Tax=Hyalangium gracile TaxID=394092 RepID=UPI001CCF45A9|nr:restriction endonuclease fold toxin-2 domain-containing protein [Hyalangium gracile]